MRKEDFFLDSPFEDRYDHALKSSKKVKFTSRTLEANDLSLAVEFFYSTCHSGCIPELL